MSAVTTAWLGLARLGRRLDRRRRRGWAEDRDRFLESYVQGRSFADVGGLYGVDGDIALKAHAAGAASVTLFDAGEPTPGFLERSRREGATIRFVQGNLEDPGSVAELGPHDVVWCTGVLYHTPHPLLQLFHLREITRELLFLGTHTIPEIPGIPQASVFYPYLDRGHRRAFAAPHPDPEWCYGVGTPFDDRPMYGHGNFWWGITPSALRAMLRTARFEVVEEFRPGPYPWEVDVLARPVPEHPSLPPVEYYRERGRRRERGEPQLAFHGYYDKGPGPHEVLPRTDGLVPDRPGPFRRWRRRRGSKHVLAED